MEHSLTSPPSYAESVAPVSLPPFTPTPSLFLTAPPPLDPTWLSHEQDANLWAPRPAGENPRTAYSKAGKARNAKLLTGRDSHLDHGIAIFDTAVEGTTGKIPVRTYNPESRVDGPRHPLDSKRKSRMGEGELGGTDIVVYYHGGGLYVGDLDSEDLTCRRIVKGLGCTVYSVAYRLMPEVTADDAFGDAFAAFMAITKLRQARRLIVMGSSSGGQLAAMVSQKYALQPMFRYRPVEGAALVGNGKIHGVLLRGPVTCDPANLPERFKGFHKSLLPAFHTSLAAEHCINAENRTTGKMPLEAEMAKLPRHWIQVCTNDVFYSDGALYADALRESGVEVEMDVVEGFPHTFWIKAPELERAVEAEIEMLEGLKWLLESPVKEEDVQPEEKKAGFVPFSDAEIRAKFAGEE